MSDQDLFKDETLTKTQETLETPASDPFSDQLKKIKSPDGAQKYKDVPTALDGLEYSQQFIETLKDRLKEAKTREEALQSELSKSKSVEDFVSQLKTPTDDVDKQETPAVQNSISENDISKMLDEKLNQKAKAQVETQNVASVIETLKQATGSEEAAKAHIAAKAAELNTTPAKLGELARTNPELAIAALSVTAAKPAPKTLSSTANLPYPTEVVKDLTPVGVNQGIARGGLTDQELRARFRESSANTNRKLGLEE